MAPTWKPAKTTGNYGKAVSAAAHARNAARLAAKSIDGKMVTGRPSGTNTGQSMTHSADANPNTQSPVVPDPAGSYKGRKR